MLSGFALRLGGAAATCSLPASSNRSMFRFANSVRFRRVLRRLLCLPSTGRPGVRVSRCRCSTSDVWRSGPPEGSAATVPISMRLSMIHSQVAWMKVVVRRAGSSDPWVRVKYFCRLPRKRSWRLQGARRASSEGSGTSMSFKAVQVFVVHDLSPAQSFQPLLCFVDVPGDGALGALHDIGRLFVVHAPRQRSACTASRCLSGSSCTMSKADLASFRFPCRAHIRSRPPAPWRRHSGSALAGALIIAHRVERHPVKPA